MISVALDDRVADCFGNCTCGEDHVRVVGWCQEEISNVCVLHGLEGQVRIELVVDAKPDAEIRTIDHGGCGIIERNLNGICQVVILICGHHLNHHCQIVYGGLIRVVVQNLLVD